MKRADHDRLDRLLARGRLSRPEKERMFDEVVRATKPARSARRWLGVLLPAMAILVLVPLFVMRRPYGGGFTAKGAVGQPRIEAACVDGCKAGATLVFRTAEVARDSVLVAWAEDPHGQRIWYFPTDGGEAPKIAPHREAEALRRGIRIGPEHAAARYALTMMLLPPGMYSRDEVLTRTEPRVQQPLEILK